MRQTAKYGCATEFLSESYLDINPSHNHLGNQIFVDAVLAALPSKPTLLDPSKRRNRVTNSTYTRQC